MDRTQTTPSDALQDLRNGWRSVVAGLPEATTWAVEAEFVGTTGAGRAVATRGVLSHDGERVRFSDWRGTLLVDHPLRRMAGSVAHRDLRCEIDDRVLRFDDFAHLRERLVHAPDFSVEPDDVFTSFLLALHDAR